MRVTLLLFCYCLALCVLPLLPVCPPVRTPARSSSRFAPPFLALLVGLCPSCAFLLVFVDVVVALPARAFNKKFQRGLFQPPKLAFSYRVSELVSPPAISFCFLQYISFSSFSFYLQISCSLRSYLLRNLQNPSFVIRCSYRIRHPAFAHYPKKTTRVSSPFLLSNLLVSPSCTL